MPNKSNYIEKELTWKHAVGLFPDLWISFKDCEFKGAIFMKGILVDVISANDRIKYIEEHQGEKLHINRTAEDTLWDTYMAYLLKNHYNKSDRPIIYTDVVNDIVVV